MWYAMPVITWLPLASSSPEYTCVLIGTRVTTKPACFMWYTMPVITCSVLFVAMRQHSYFTPPFIQCTPAASSSGVRLPHTSSLQSQWHAFAPLRHSWLQYPSQSKSMPSRLPPNVSSRIFLKYSTNSPNWSSLHSSSGSTGNDVHHEPIVIVTVTPFSCSSFRFFWNVGSAVVELPSKPNGSSHVCFCPQPSVLLCPGRNHSDGWSISTFAMNETMFTGVFSTPSAVTLPFGS